MVKKPRSKLPKKGLESLERIICAAFDAAGKSPVIAASIATLPYGVIRLLDSGNQDFWSPRRQAEAMTNELFQTANLLAQGGGPQLVTPFFSVGPGSALLPAPETKLDMNRFVDALLTRFPRK